MNLTFVVGAGARSELDLPIGDELTKNISELCNFQIDYTRAVSGGSKELRDAFGYSRVPNSEKNFAQNQLAHEAIKIGQAMALAPSIDNYLDAHKDKDARVLSGKFAIAKAILDAERGSALYRDPSNINNIVNFASLPDNWLVELFRLLVSQQSVETFSKRLERCKFICFNYDRVIEQFFFFAIQTYFEKDASEAKKICDECLNIVHPYGTAGEFKFVQDDTSFGLSDHPRQIVAAASQIRTFTEGTSETNIKSRIIKTLDDSDCIVVLGFAFHPLNVRVLAPHRNVLIGPRRIVGTSIGLGSENLEIIRNELGEALFGTEADSEFQNIGCADLIRYHASYFTGR